MSRDLKIKTGVVKRLFKEYMAYQKEEQKQKERIEQLKQKQPPPDQADIRKQEEVLQETVQMLPDCKKRLESAYKELLELTNQDGLKETKEWQEAQEVLKSVDCF